MNFRLNCTNDWGIVLWKNPQIKAAQSINYRATESVSLRPIPHHKIAPIRPLAAKTIAHGIAEPS